MASLKGSIRPRKDIGRFESALGMESPLAKLAKLAQARSSSLVVIADGGLFMAHLAEQFASAIADGQFEAAMAMLAGSPSLATMPCRKALYSSLHWSCASVKLAPLTRALLALGCPVDGYAFNSERPDADSPLRWAASCGNIEALHALIEHGAKPVLSDLLEACRRARGDCALVILSAAPYLDPNDAKPGSESCKAALVRAAAELSTGAASSAQDIQHALAVFERMALEGQFEGGKSGAGAAGSKRL